MIFSWFLNRELTEGDVVDLRLEARREPSYGNSYTASEIYAITLHGHSAKIGECDLRIGMNEELYYAGNIGYRIYEKYRGSGYACEAARMLMRIAKEKHHMTELILTCSPDNIASRKTLEKLGGELIETVNVPSAHWLYRRGEKVKNIYRFVL